MAAFPDLLDVVLQVVEEQLHHVQLLLGPPEPRDGNVTAERQRSHQHLQRPALRLLQTTLLTRDGVTALETNHSLSPSRLIRF